MNLLEFVGTVIPAILLLLSLTGRILLETVEHPSERYDDKVQKLRQHRWGEVSGELGEIMVEVREIVEDDEEELGNDEPTEQAAYSVVLQKKYNKEMLGDLVTEIEEYDEPKLHYRQCRESQDELKDHLLTTVLLSAIGLTGIGGLSITSPDPISELIVFTLSWLVLGLATAFLWASYNEYNQWRESRASLDKMWEDFYFT